MAEKDPDALVKRHIEPDQEFGPEHAGQIAADAKIDAFEIGAERIFGGEREIAHFEQAVAARRRGTVLRMGQVAAYHHAREIGAALPARIAVPGDASGTKHRRAIAQRADFVQLVTDVEDRTAFGGQMPERGEELVDRCRRQHRRRLVHDQQLRRLQKAADDLDALTLADRKRVHAAARIERQAVACGSLANPRVEFASAAILFEPECDVLGDGQRFEQRELLEYHTDAERARLCWTADGHRFAVPPDRAGVRPHDAVDDLDQRRLAGAVFAEYRVDLAWRDGEIDAVVGDGAGEALADAGKLEARCRRRIHLRQRRRILFIAAREWSAHRVRRRRSPMATRRRSFTACRLNARRRPADGPRPCCARCRESRCPACASPSCRNTLRSIRRKSRRRCRRC